MGLIYCDIVNADDLLKKYDYGVISRKLNALFKKYPSKNIIRIYGEDNQNKFIRYYNSLNDFDKQRYININYHPVPIVNHNEQRHLGEPWMWVLDIKYRIKKEGD